MITSTVAHEVTRALHDFLATGFGPYNPALATVMDDFLAQPENLVKGPYLSIALPPKLAPGGEPFPEVPLGFTPYRHQRIAHQRLDSAAPHGGRSTVVATGTGSGKTECFLWPILDRLQVPRQAGLVCVGTSATIGGEENSTELRKYAADLFGQPFDANAVLTEERQSIDDVLGSAIIQRHVAAAQPRRTH